MSKLDQLKLLGANRLAKSSSEAKGKPRMPAGSKTGDGLTRNSSDGGVESRHARQVRTTGQWLQDGGAQPSNLQPGTEAGVAPGPSDSKSKGGRPLAKDADKALAVTQPWLAEGMSRASWYRRQKEKQK